LKIVNKPVNFLRWVAVLVAFLLTPLFVQVCASAESTGTQSGTTEPEVIGYAWPKADLLITNSIPAAFKRLRNGGKYRLIAKLETGYSIVAPKTDGQEGVAFMPLRDRLGNAITVNIDGEWVTVSCSRVILDTLDWLDLKPGVVPLEAGKKYRVLKDADEKLTVQFTTNSFRQPVEVAAATVDYLSVADFEKGVHSLLDGLTSKAEASIKSGQYATVGDTFNAYTGRFAQETVDARKELAKEFQAKADRLAQEQQVREERARQETELKYEAEQRAKGLVKYEGQWLLPEEVRKREALLEQTRKAAEFRETLGKVQRGVLGGMALEYDFTLMKDLPVGGPVELDAGGWVELLVSGRDRVELYVWSRSSPSNRNKEWVQFPFSGFVSLEEKDVSQFEELVRKFLEWENRADRYGLKDVGKEIGELGEYGYKYNRSARGQGWLTISPRSIDLRQIKEIKEILKKTVTVFPPAAEASLKLLSVRHVLRTQKLQREAEKEDAQQRANELLK
jgi:hypothetical protein